MAGYFASKISSAHTNKYINDLLVSDPAIK